MTSTARLQREADASRVELADTLGQLRDGLAPSALSSEAIALVKDSGLSLVKTLAEQARANPVPALLIGAGLTMLLTRTTGSDVMGVASSTLKSAAATGAGAARSAASATAAKASSAAATVASAASGGRLLGHGRGTRRRQRRGRPRRGHHRRGPAPGKRGLCRHERQGRQRDRGGPSRDARPA